MILLTRPFLQLVSTDLVFLCLAFAIILCPDLKYSCVSTILTSSLHSLPAYTSQWLWAWSNSAEGFLDLPGPAFSQPLLLTPNYGTHTICQMSMLSCPVRKMKPQTSARSLPSVQFSSLAQSCLTLCDPMNRSTARQASLFITISRSSLRLTSIESVMPSSHLILGCPLLLLSAIPPSIRDFSNESMLHMRWPKYWSFSFSIIPS